MKHVHKGKSPRLFELWKAKANPDWEPIYDNLQDPEKAALHTALLQEQAWVCCYCGRSISQKDSHIEHFRPQEFFKPLALTFENLHASCIRETKRGSPLHCGHVKGSKFVEALHISPTDPSCEGRFRYSYIGEIIEEEAADQQASYMVGLLQLDISFLNNRREESLKKVFDPAFLSSATDGELKKLRDAFRAPDEKGRATPFGHVVARFAEQRLLDGTP